MDITSIVVDGTFKKGRYLVLINHVPVPLPGKSFMYFSKLAYFRKQGDGWVHENDLEEGYNQTRYLYRMKHEIMEKLGNGWGIIKNKKQGYYQLDVDPKVIEFNKENLRKHEDFNVRGLFKREISRN